ncbi:bifunctional riboflavin kinase/FAD synthetase [Candidatus Oleimmundimicrobium sp.]|uniref:bifunctional riboflavin kinase/FAD synthetase n=1 Tax=Candidatus Oleimmundimicrobium sp. TaxID=3060597 RepID=UPI00271C6380|nr:bifunctional riboflavin kinase/FAD synthetase [Candidatus Oleimmundimicrobium sp.]MDO8885444.1 bifunctional riboflavin kinase/FAD synthetase [Candidatus Oleimmundimicrobium sp.]
MKVIFGVEKLKLQKKKSIVAIGVFDGVHRGHQAIIETIVKDAHDLKVQSVVVTFEPHPLEILVPGAHLPILTGFDLKAKLIERMGVGLLLIIKFTKKFSQMPAQAFIDEILLKKLNVIEVVVGEGFRFGKNSAGDIQLLTNYGRERGYAVKSIPLVYVGGKAISSTRIRELLERGKILEARKILGHYPKLIGKVVQGCGRGRDIGFCTANIETKDKDSVPREGVYAGFVQLNGEAKACVVNIGGCPTFNVKRPRIEIHIIGFDKNIYGNKIEIEIVENIRKQKKFKDKSSLACQIEKDIAKAKKLLCGKFTEFNKYGSIGQAKKA